MAGKDKRAGKDRRRRKLEERARGARSRERQLGVRRAVREQETQPTAWTDPEDYFVRTEQTRLPVLSAIRKLYGDILPNEIPGDATVLEIAAGRRFLTRHGVVPRGMRRNWIETDIHPPALMGGEPGKRLAASFYRLPFRTESVGAVLGFSCLDLVPRRLLPKVLGEVHRVLKPGGKLIHIADSVPESLPPRLARELSRLQERQIRTGDASATADQRRLMLEAHDIFQRKLTGAMREHGFEVTFAEPIEDKDLVTRGARHTNSPIIQGLQPAARAHMQRAPVIHYDHGILKPEQYRAGVVIPRGKVLEIITCRMIAAKKKD